MKASVWANVLEEGQEKGKKRARKGQEKILALIRAFFMKGALTIC